MSAASIKFSATIPANPGFHVLEVQHDQSCPSGAIKNPVMAWALEEEFLTPYPITANGVETDNVYVLSPDGTVNRPFADWFPSYNAWLEDRQADYKASQDEAVLPVSTPNHTISPSIAGESGG